MDALPLLIAEVLAILVGVTWTIVPLIECLARELRSPLARYRRQHLPLFWIAAAILLLSGGGCATRQIYNAGELPVAFQAQALPDPVAINLPSPVRGKSDVIGPGYVLEISLAAGLDKDSNTTVHVRAAEDGTARLPEIGQVRLAGLTEVQAEEQIAAALVQGGLYRHPTVSVHIDHRPTNDIIVIGAVKNPGTHPVPRSSSCLGTAIMEAGGLTEKAGMKVRVTGSNHNVVVDIADENQRLIPLDDGDTVSVEKRELQPVQVIGLVTKPVEVEFPVGRPLRLTNAISMANGESNDLADSVLIQRLRPDGQGVVLIQASLGKAMENGHENLILAPGNVIRVERTFATFAWDSFKRIGIGIGGSMPIP